MAQPILWATGEVSETNEPVSEQSKRASVDNIGLYQWDER